MKEEDSPATIVAQATPSVLPSALKSAIANKGKKSKNEKRAAAFGGFTLPSLQPPFRIDDLDYDSTMITIKRLELMGLFEDKGCQKKMAFVNTLAYEGCEVFSKRVICLTRDFNPLAPIIPGESGFKCTVNWHRGLTEECVLFVRVDKKLGWRMLGNYKGITLTALPTAEWNVQAQTVKATWAESICTMSWGLPVRARISLRKKGLPITNEAVEAAILAARADEKPRDCFTDVTEVDVNQAFERGDEKIYLETLECVGYNADLQQEIVDYVNSDIPAQKAQERKERADAERLKRPGSRRKPKEKEEKRKKGVKTEQGLELEHETNYAEDRQGKKRKSASRKSSPRKRARKEDSEESDTIQEVESEVDDVEEEEYTYRARPTTARQRAKLGR